MARAARKRLACAYTPFLVIEAFAGLAQNPRNFRQLRLGARRLFRLRARPLCHDDRHIVHLAQGTKPGIRDLAHWAGPLASLARASRLSDVQLLIDGAVQYRGDSDGDYVAALGPGFLHELAAAIRDDRGLTAGADRTVRLPLRGEWLARWKAALSTEELTTTLVTSALSCAGAEVPDDPESFAALRGKLRFSVEGWLFLANAVVEHGRLPGSGSNRNDHNDLLLLTQVD